MVTNVLYYSIDIRLIQSLMYLSLQGQAINFPVNTSELFSSLPRPVDRAGI